MKTAIPLFLLLLVYVQAAPLPTPEKEHIGHLYVSFYGGKNGKNVEYAHQIYNRSKEISLRALQRVLAILPQGEMKVIQNYVSQMSIFSNFSAFFINEIYVNASDSHIYKLGLKYGFDSPNNLTFVNVMYISKRGPTTTWPNISHPIALAYFNQTPVNYDISRIRDNSTILELATNQARKDNTFGGILSRGGIAPPLPDNATITLSSINFYESYVEFYFYCDGRKLFYLCIGIYRPPYKIVKV